ncbi:hypothetical protein ACFSSF_05200 [Dietzia aerolata]|uniref:hypothetical protein n=1 Tax=Dietzia aerolata TaxID=595984 RepID=UPI00363EA2C3
MSLLGWYRSTGADLPFGDPLRAHGVAMEGYFLRLTDRERGRVVIALIGVNRGPEGHWATLGLASDEVTMPLEAGDRVGRVTGRRCRRRRIFLPFAWPPRRTAGRTRIASGPAPPTGSSTAPTASAWTWATARDCTWTSPTPSRGRTTP